MEKILVAIDGSENSHRALMKAKKIGTALNSEITIINVMKDVQQPPYSRINEYRGPLKDVFNKQAREIIEHAMEDFKDYKYKVDTLIEKGNPGNEIARVAEEGGYTLIIIGSRGLGAVSRLMLGGVSNKVVNNSNISVLVVK